MNYLPRLKTLVFLIPMAILSHFSYGQELGMKDILEMYPLDSISLKKVCADKGFSLGNITEDHWIFNYTFQSNDGKKIAFSKTFPKDTTANTFASYYFFSRKSYKDLKKQLKESGFAFIRESSKDYGSVAYSKEVYQDNSYEITFTVEQRNGMIYSFNLMLYKISTQLLRKG